MIITKEVKIKLNNRHIKHYKKLGYDTTQKEFFVKVEHLLKNSNYKIDVKCDKCDKEKKLSYHKYNKNLNNGGYYSCSNKCSVEKGVKTSIEKYGVDYIAKTYIFKEQARKTKLEKYGDENYNNPEKIKETCLEKYGVEYSFQSDLIKDKIKETNLKIYGCENPFQNEEIKNKIRETNFDRYGEYSYSKTEKYKKHMKSLNIDYSITQEKLRKTSLEKYGVEYPAQNINIFNKTQKTQLKIKYYKGIRYQGTYELDFLKYCDNNNIIKYISKPKTIRYNFKNKKRVYYPDFYIEKLNLIVEIKSSYYYDLMLEKNIAKQNECINQKYNFIFIIDKDYSKIKEIIKKPILS